MSNIISRLRQSILTLSPFRFVAWALLAVGAAYFTLSAWQAAYSPSMDYAVVVDMARNMAEGIDFPTFFYGQAYMGSLEPAVSAILCAIFGLHPFWVCMGSAFFGIATLFVVMRLARSLGGELASCFALAFAICGGAYWIHFTVSPRGGYALAALLCLLAMHFASSVDFVDGGTHKVRIVPSFAFGLAAGLAFWNFWIAAPAFFSACIMLFLRMRRRIFSPRFLASASIAFFIGSLPWWIWLLRNGLSSFYMNPGVLKPPGLKVIYDIVGIVIPRFFFPKGDVSTFWRSIFPWPLIAIALYAVLDAALGRSRKRRLFISATLLYALAFFAMYAFTSFGSANIVRYFTHFVPTFSVAGGAALGAAFSNRSKKSAAGKAASIPAIAIVATWCVIAAPQSFRAASATMNDLQTMGRKWKASIDALADDPVLAQPAFAEFAHFGANWASNRRITLVSPLRWRYVPYLENLECASNPTVIDNFQAFREFCTSTCGICSSHKTANFNVTDSIAAPPVLDTLPVAAIKSATITRDGNLVDALPSLFDDNLASSVFIRKSSQYIDVAFAEPVNVAGIYVISTYSRSLCGWRVETIPDGDDAPQILSRCNPIAGWFWSGGRPFMFGPDSRLELRWQPQTLSGIRIVFEGRNPDSPKDLFVANVADIRILDGTSCLPPVVIDEVKNTIDVAHAKMPDAHIHAGRSLAHHLGAMPDPALTYGRDGASLSIPEVCSFATLDPIKGAIIALQGESADAAASTFESLCIPFSRGQSGGCSVFEVPATPALSAHRIRFYGGRIFCDQPIIPDLSSLPSALFGGAWRMSLTAPLPAKLQRGTSSLLEFFLVAEDLAKCDSRKNLFAYIHAVRDGNILFQGITVIDPLLVMQPADAPAPTKIAIQLDVPADITPGPVALMLCIKKDGGLLRLKPSSTDLTIDKRRIVIGNAIVENQ